MLHNTYVCNDSANVQSHIPLHDNVFHTVNHDVSTHVDVNVNSSSSFLLHNDLFNFTHCFYAQNVDTVSSSLLLPDFPVDFRQAPQEVGGRLSFFYDNYKLLTDNRFLLNVIKDGYQLKFIDNQPPPLTVNAQPFYLHLSDAEQLNLDNEMQTFLDNHVIEPADPSTPGFYSTVFLREKRPDNDQCVNAPKKYRVIHDLSKLNMFIVKYKFKMDSAATVRASLKQGMHFYTLDIKSAYNHILIHPRSRKYLRCWWKGACWQFRALPFGLSSAPWIFTSIMSITAKYLHRHSVYSLFYLDDVNVFNALLCKLMNDQPFVLLFFQLAGWLLNLPKSMLDGVQRGVYIGIDLDLYHGLVFPTPKKWRNLQDIIQQFHQLSQAPARQWARLLGLITCVQDLTPLGRVQARSLQFHLNAFWKDRKNLYQLIPITQAVKSDLQWWQQPSNVMCGTPLQPRPATEVITTDSSLQGWGALWRDRELAGLWSSAEAKLHINVLEAKCVVNAIKAWTPHLLGLSVLIQCDNTTVVSHLRRGSGCRSATQHQVIKDLLLWCHQHQIQLSARHLLG